MNKNRSIRLLRVLVAIGLVLATLIFVGLGMKNSVLGNVSVLSNAKEFENVKLDSNFAIKTKKSDISIAFASQNKQENDNFVPGDILVKFKNIESKTSFLDQNPTLKSLNSQKSELLMKLEFPKTIEDKSLRTKTVDLINELRLDDRVEVAQPNFLKYLAFVPNDPLYGYQWGMKNNGNLVLGSETGQVGRDIKAEQAWDITQGSPNVVIAIIDSGTDFNHPDLAPNIFRDSQGRVIGKNFATGCNSNGLCGSCDFSNANGTDNTSCPYQDAFTSHGTSVAGAAAAKGNNSIGVTGVCSNCKIMPFKISDVNTGIITTSSVINSINYAVANGASVINMSLGGPNQSPLEAQAVANALANNIAVVSASGNCGIDDPVELKANACKTSNNSSICLDPQSTATVLYSNGCIAANGISYPSGFAGVISVSSTSLSGIKSSFATANNMVTLSAPGNAIASTYPLANSTQCPVNSTSNCCPDTGGLNAIGYCFVSGTSFASPIVAGIVGLMKSQNISYTPTYIKNRLILTSDDIYAQNPTMTGLLGSGRVNACKALGSCGSPLVFAASSSSSVSSSVSSSISSSVSSSISSSVSSSPASSISSSISSSVLSSLFSLSSSSVSSSSIFSSSRQSSSSIQSSSSVSTISSSQPIPNTNAIPLTPIILNPNVTTTTTPPQNFNPSPEVFSRLARSDVIRDFTINTTQNQTNNSNPAQGTTVPNNGDGNGDGVEDTKQDNVKTFKSIGQNSYITTEVEGTGDCNKIAQISPVESTSQNKKDSLYSYPFGMVDFKINCGGTSKVTMYWHGVEDLDKEGYEVRKYGPTIPGNSSTIDWYNSNAIKGTKTIGNKKVAYITYILRDGEAGDDTAKDGVIVDPIGIAKKAISSPSTTNFDNSNKSLPNPSITLPRTGGVG
jgi:subtilisin family serine protease